MRNSTAYDAAGGEWIEDRLAANVRKDGAEKPLALDAKLREMPVQPFLVRFGTGDVPEEP